MRKKYKKRNYNYKFFGVFAVTLSFVLLIGVATILIYNYWSGDAGWLNPAEDMADFDGETELISHPITQDAVDIPVNDQPYADVLGDAAYMAENRIYSKEVAVPGEVRLCFAGDILFDDAYAVMATAIQRGGTVDRVFSSDLLERMKAADIMMLNNEFPYTIGGVPTPEKQYTFRADPETATWLEDMGVDIVSLANNHAFDFGETGLLDTLDTLQQLELPYVGAGNDLDEASAPVYIIADGLKIAFIGATQIERLDNPDTRGATDTRSGVFRCWNPQQLIETVAEAKENSDFVVVYIHWGTENVPDPDWAQQDQAPQIAAAGADLIIGSHPHCLQGITYSGDVPVIYSLGNFWFNSRPVDTGMLEVVINTDGIKTIQFVPAIQENCSTELSSGSEKERILQIMRDLSPGIAIDSDGYVR
ncbi:MAG: CapA family protein [Lachnospiraceae bacterium]|nr:CapA family protein [Lachnospiraceae bacterium]